MNTTIPVAIEPEVETHVAQLGLRQEMERMIEFICQNIAGLHRLDVELQLPYDTGDEDQVIFSALRDPAYSNSNDPVRSTYREWEFAAFSPDVSRHVTLMIIHGDNHAE